MGSSKEAVAYVVGKLRPPERFSARAMFGEFALYCDGKTVALICDDRLYVKISPATAGLESICEKGEPYPRAKPHYLVDEGQLSTIPNLSGMLIDLAESLSASRPKKKKRPDGRALLVF
jgi:hypothetical protein